MTQHKVAVSFLVGTESRYELTVRRAHPIHDDADVERLTADLRNRFGTTDLRILGFQPTIGDLRADGDGT
jgi:hypothetical protein